MARSIPPMFHPGVSRSAKRAAAGLAGWMAHQFELLADGRVWEDLTKRSLNNDFTRHLDGEPSVFCAKPSKEAA